MDLVERFKDQEFAFILELVRNLSPHCGHLVKHLLMHFRIYGGTLNVKPVFAVAAIVMHVDDCDQSCILSITNDLGNPVKPSLLYLVVRSRADMSHPGHRDADSRKSCRLDLIESSLGSLRIAP